MRLPLQPLLLFLFFGALSEACGVRDPRSASRLRPVSRDGGGLARARGGAGGHGVNEREVRGALWGGQRNEDGG